MSDQGLAFDFSPLRQSVPEAQARAEASERFRTEGGAESQGQFTTGAVLKSVVLVAGAWALAVVFVRVIQLFGGAPGVTVSTIVIGGLMVVPLVVAQIRGVGGGLRRMRRTWYLLSRFAAANGLTHAIRKDTDGYPAQLFSRGGTAVANDVVNGQEPRSFEAANYLYNLREARGQAPGAAAYVVFDAVNALPSLALIAASTSGGTASWAPKAGQKPLELGGELGEHFHVHCDPADAEAVQGVLSPGVSAGLIEFAGEVDVEFTDGRIFFLARREGPIVEPAFWEWVEDLSRMLDNGLDPRPGVPTGMRYFQDAARAERRRKLFSRSGAGRMFLIGCLIPLVVGIALGIMTVNWA